MRKYVACAAVAVATTATLIGIPAVVGAQARWLAGPSARLTAVKKTTLKKNNKLERHLVITYRHNTRNVLFVQSTSPTGPVAHAAYCGVGMVQPNYCTSAPTIDTMFGAFSTSGTTTFGSTNSTQCKSLGYSSAPCGVYTNTNPELLVAFVSTDGPAGYVQTVQSTTPWALWRLNDCKSSPSPCGSNTAGTAWYGTGTGTGPSWFACPTSTSSCTAGTPSGTASNPSNLAADASGNGNTGAYSSSGVTYQTAYPSTAASPIAEGAGGHGVALAPSGSSGGSVISTNEVSTGSSSAPIVYTEETWFQTAKSYTGGGTLATFGDKAGGSASLNKQEDRQIYMTNTGQIAMGGYAAPSGSTGYTYTIISTKSYNDGNWHFVAGTESATINSSNGTQSTTFELYVDGAPVATTYYKCVPNIAAGTLGSGSTACSATSESAGPVTVTMANYQQNYKAAGGSYWELGVPTNEPPGTGDWPDGTNTYFTGSEADAALYNSTALTAAQISAQYAARGTNGNQTVTVSCSSPSGGGTCPTFHKVNSANQGAGGDTEIWYADAGAISKTAPVFVNATDAKSGCALGSVSCDISLTVVSFKNAITPGATSGPQSTGIGNSSSCYGLTGAPSCPTTTSEGESWVWGVGEDWGAATSVTPNSGQTAWIQILDQCLLKTFWLQSTSSADASTVANGSTITIGDSAPTTDPWNLTTVEIL